jgi:hypothetical protein
MFDSNWASMSGTTNQIICFISHVIIPEWGEKHDGCLSGKGWKITSSLAFYDDYDGVLCCIHGDGIPSVMTSRVCEKPPTSISPRPCKHASKIQWQSAEWVTAVAWTGGKVACKSGYSFCDNVAGGNANFLTKPTRVLPDWSRGGDIGYDPWLSSVRSVQCGIAT